jgi:hypothetical protein
MATTPFHQPWMNLVCLPPGIKVGNNNPSLDPSLVTFLHLGKVPTKDQVSILSWMM